MSLGKQQRTFTKDIAELILWAYEQGYELTIGDGFRDARVHGNWGDKGSYSHRYSLHKKRLALDLNLFIGGVYQTTTEAHKPLGEHWESMREGNSWGGHFGDGNHYSSSYAGYK